MNALPRAARWYLVVLWFTAVSWIIVTLLRNPLLLEHVQLLAIWLPLYILADYFEIEIALGDEPSFRITVADAPTIFLIVVGGPACVIGMAVGSVIVDAIQRRPWYKCLFNGAHRSITYL